MEVLKVAVERESVEDEFELSLELSIGRRYGKSIKMEGKNVSRSDFYCNDNNKRDLELKRNIINIPQDFRKKESCVEREVKLILDGQQFRSGFEDVENGEKDVILENSARNFEKNGKREIELDLNGDFEGEQMQYAKSDARHSRCSLRSNYMVKRLKVDHSYTTNNPHSADKDQPSPIPAKLSHLVKKPPKPPTLKKDGASVRHMPCVSTTGNGPNGKSITGFLYKYTKNEVRIVCICHRRIFSPAEFVEHAGGVDILNPLRHITIVNSAQR